MAIYAINFKSTINFIVMKYLLGLLIVVCVGWQSCANDDIDVVAIEAVLPKCEISLQEKKDRIRELEEKYCRGGSYIEVVSYDSVTEESLKKAEDFFIRTYGGPID